MWAAKTHAELARDRRPGARDGRTDTDRAADRRTRSLPGSPIEQTADALFISPKTVQWNLSKIYRKLGIRSRAELPARLAAGKAPEPR